MKVLITGSGGFLGTHVVDRMLAHGYTDLRCMLRDTMKRSRLEAVASRYREAQLEYIAGNLKSPADAAAAVNGVDVVIHLAAGMRGAIADLFLDSVVASRNLLDAIGQRPVRLILVSSFSVYGVADLGRGAVVDEATPVEGAPTRRDAYAYTKLRQEELFWEYQKQNGFELVVLRPGVIYGAGSGHFSSRIGLALGDRFLYLGGRNPLPLSYVSNCAEAVVVAGLASDSAGQVFNVVDDDLPTCRQYFQRYCREVRRMDSWRIPYPVFLGVAHMMEKYHHYSKGQLPAVFTPYKVRSMWGGNQFKNEKLRSTGWRQLVSTDEGMRRTFAAFRSDLARTADRHRPDVGSSGIDLENPDNVANSPNRRIHVMDSVLQAPPRVVRTTGTIGAEYRKVHPGCLIIGCSAGRCATTLREIMTAFRQLRRSSDRLRLVVIGAGAAVDEARQFAEHARMEDDIFFTGEQADVAAWMPAFDVYVQAPSSSAMPVALLEAMAAGIPVVAANSGFVREVLSDGRSGRLVPVNDANALGAALQGVLEDAELRLALGSTAQAFMQNSYGGSLFAGRASYGYGIDGAPSRVRMLLKRLLKAGYPKSSLVWHGSREVSQFALTFDDGPEPIYTPRILEILRRYDLKATFFLVGNRIEEHSEIAHQILAEGHELGNHSYSHQRLNQIPVSVTLRELQMTARLIEQLQGRRCELFRPPFGKMALRSIYASQRLGERFIMWSVDPKDFRAVAPEEIIYKLGLQPIMNGDVILYHGTNEAAISALPSVIKAAREGGREGVTISDLQM